MDNQITFIETINDNFDDLLLDKIKKCFDDNRFPYENIVIRKNINDISYLVTGQIFFKKLISIHAPAWGATLPKMLKGWF